MGDKNAYQLAATDLESQYGNRFVRFTVSGRDAEVGQEDRPHEVYVEGVGTASGKTLADALAAAKKLK